MFNRHRYLDRYLALLGLGLGLMALRGKRRLRRYAIAQMLGRGVSPGAFGPGGFGRFGARAPWMQGDINEMPLPPFIEARLKAWHEKAQGSAPAAGTQPAGTAQF